MIHADSSNGPGNVQRVVRYMEWEIGEEYVGKMADFRQSPNNLLEGGFSFRVGLRYCSLGLLQLIYDMIYDI